MPSSMSLKLACVAVLCFIMGAPLAQGAINCPQVLATLSPCAPYMATEGSDAVPQSCCDGIRSLNASAGSTPDRKLVCRCLKRVTAFITSFNYGLASKVPGSCGVNFPYELSPAIDCKSVK